MPDTSGSEGVFTRLQRIAEAARKNPDGVFTSLNHFLGPELLRAALQRVRKDGAPGVDGQSWAEYEADFESRLPVLLDLAKSGLYRAPPVRRVHIPKGTGPETRPIGIPTIEDKLLQRAVVMILEAIYEQDFHPGSFGFRPGRSAHQALGVLREAAMGMGGGWVLEVDLRKFFDTVDHAHLRAFVRRRVRDGVILRLIGKWLKAGVLEEGSVSYPDRGTPQGGVISPLLANVYLHEVLDTWWERDVKPRLRGRATLVRYADDFGAACNGMDPAGASPAAAVVRTAAQRYPTPDAGDRPGASSGVYVLAVGQPAGPDRRASSSGGRSTTRTLPHRNLRSRESGCESLEMPSPAKSDEGLWRRGRSDICTWRISRCKGGGTWKGIRDPKQGRSLDRPSGQVLRISKAKSEDDLETGGSGRSSEDVRDRTTRAERRTRGLAWFRTDGEAGPDMPKGQPGQTVRVASRNEGLGKRRRMPPAGRVRPQGARAWSRTGENPPYGILEGVRETGWPTPTRACSTRLLLFEHEADARRVQAVLPKRFEKYGLTVHPEKTRLVPFERPRSGHPEPGEFDLLGFTHRWERSRRGYWVIMRRTAKSRFRRGLQRIAQWCRANRHQPIRVQQRALALRLRGHDAYYGITGNLQALQAFRWQVYRIWRAWLSRRSQRGRLSWERFWALLKRFPLPRARVVHSIYRSAAHA